MGLTLKRMRLTRKRLLVVIPGHDHGGAERYAQAIAEAAAGAGWGVLVVVRSAAAVAPLRRSLRAEGLHVLMLPRRKRWSFVGLLTMIGLYRPDAVHLTLPWPLSAGELRAACAIAGARTVIVHQLVPDVADLADDPAFRRLYALERLRRQTWVSVSQFGRRVLSEAFGLAEDEVRVIYNGAREVRKEPAATLALRERLGIKGEERVLVSVGRLSRVKGHDVLIEAARKLRDTPHTIRVVIAGDGNERKALREQISRSGLDGRVQLIGQIDSVDSLLALANLFVFPSRFEGTPFAMLEAMSIGLPVIATRFGGADELIVDGVNGFLVPLNDSDALAAAIDFALSHPEAAAAAGCRGRELIRRHSRQAMVDQTLELLDGSA